MVSLCKCISSKVWANIDTVLEGVWETQDQIGLEDVRSGGEHCRQFINMKGHMQ